MKIQVVHGPGVRRLISVNPGLNFNPGFFFFRLKAFYRTIFPILFRSSNHQAADQRELNWVCFASVYICIQISWVLTLIWTTRPGSIRFDFYLVWNRPIFRLISAQFHIKSMNCKAKNKQLMIIGLFIDVTCTNILLLNVNYASQTQSITWI